MAEVTGYTKTQVDTLLSDKADALGTDDNYVTDGEKTALANLGTAAAADAEDFAPAGSGAYPVQQVTLTGDLAYTLPVGAPTDQVVGVVFTQDGTGGHTVTYGGNAVAVESAAGAQTLVEIWPNGEAVVIGAPVAAGSVAWADVTDKPATYAPTAHKASHATGGTDALTPSDVGAAPALGADDNYVTDDEKVKLANLSGTNTGDQDLSGLVPTSRTVAGKALTEDITLSASDVGAAPALGADDNYVTDAQLARLSTSDTKTVNTITAAASVTVSTAYAVNKLTMTQDTTITPSLAAGSDPITALHLSGAFTPTFAASIEWPDGTAPIYTSPAVYVFLTVDGGTTWAGVSAGKAFA